MHIYMHIWRKKKTVTEQATTRHFLPMNQADDGKCSFSIAEQVAQMMHFDCAAFTHCTVNLKAAGKKKSALFFENSNGSWRPGGSLE